MEVIDLLSEASRKFGALPEHHPNERDEWRHTLHILQEKVMCRAAIRSYPERFTPMRPSE